MNRVRRAIPGLRGVRRARAVASRTVIIIALAAIASPSGAQTAEAPWSVAITTSTPSVSVGGCSVVYLALKDATGKDVPRDPKGWRIGMADFDMGATGPAEGTVVGVYNGASSFSVCACRAAVGGSEATITAKYPGATVIEKRTQVEGVAFTSSVAVPIVASRGTTEPPGCGSVKTTTISAGGVTATAPTLTAVAAPMLTAVAVPMTTATIAGTSGTSTSTATAPTSPTRYSTTAVTTLTAVGAGQIARPTVGFGTAHRGLLTVDKSSFVVDHAGGGGVVSTAKAGGGEATTSVEPFVVYFVPGGPMQDWVNAAWTGSAAKNGMLQLDPGITTGAFIPGPFEFTGGTIVSTTIPTIDAGSKDAGRLRAVFTAGSSQLAKAALNAADLTRVFSATIAKSWMLNNYRLAVGKMDGSGITRIESFTVGLQPTTDEIGEFRLTRAAESSAFPNLIVTISASKAADWIAWYDDVVVRGNRGSATEKEFRLDFMPSTGTTPLASLKGYGVGIVALRAPSGSGDFIQKVQAVLYVTRMEWVPPGSP